MTVTDIRSSAPLRRPSIPMLVGGDYQVLLSGDPIDIVAAQRLRYRVFNDEPGYSDAIGDAATALDADRFDEHCDHLLVRYLPTGELVGCARVLPPPAAITAGGWYSAGEFDLTELDAIRPETVEMGRAVVDKAHRSGSVTALLWAALLAYLEDGGYRYLMGCVSVPVGDGADRGRDLRGIRDLARDRHRAPWQAFPYRKVIIDDRRLDDIEPFDSPRLPALLRGYVRLGARVCGEPAFDEVFDVGDFLTVLDRSKGDARYTERLRGAATRLAVPAE